MKEKPEANQGNEAATTEGAAGWITDYEAALQRAKTEKKVILADFTGSDWCGWCKRLQAEVFTKKEFQQWAAKNVVLLELDFPHKPQSDALRQQNQKLLREHNVTGYPTIVFLDAKGKKIGQTGYVEGGPSAWIKAAEMEMKK